MITEDYISFEIAKLLQEKGFHEKLFTFYITDETKKEGYFQLMAFTDDKIDNNHSDYCYLAPTLQMAMKWLREVHKIYIDISPTYSEVEKTIHFIWQIFDSNYDGVGDCEIFYGKYEIACEDAIKYCLENLI